MSDKVSIFQDRKNRQALHHRISNVFFSFSRKRNDSILAGRFLTENGEERSAWSACFKDQRVFIIRLILLLAAAGFARPILFSTRHWLATVIIPIVLIWNSTISIHRRSWWLYRNQKSGTTGCRGVLYVSRAVGRRVCRTKRSKSGALPRIIRPWPRIKILLYFLGLSTSVRHGLAC